MEGPGDLEQERGGSSPGTRGSCELAGGQPAPPDEPEGALPLAVYGVGLAGPGAPCGLQEQVWRWPTAGQHCSDLDHQEAEPSLARCGSGNPRGEGGCWRKFLGPIGARCRGR